MSGVTSKSEEGQFLHCFGTELLNHFHLEHGQGHSFCQEGRVFRRMEYSGNIDLMTVAYHGHVGSGFNLRDRAMHVYSEAARVLEFKAACDSPTLTPEQQLEELARLMDDSHASCRCVRGPSFVHFVTPQGRQLY